MSSLIASPFCRLLWRLSEQLGFSAAAAVFGRLCNYTRPYYYIVHKYIHTHVCERLRTRRKRERQEREGGKAENSNHKVRIMYGQ